MRHTGRVLVVSDDAETRDFWIASLGVTEVPDDGGTVFVRSAPSPNGTTRVAGRGRGCGSARAGSKRRPAPERIDSGFGSRLRPTSWTGDECESDPIRRAGSSSNE